MYSWTPADGPAIPFDGKLLITHQDALLVGGKVQAAAGYADHVLFIDPQLCQRCGARTCIEMCSGQAITTGEQAVPAFDREKCIHCGACLWNCSQTRTAKRATSNSAPAPVDCILLKIRERGGGTVSMFRVSRILDRVAARPRLAA